MALGTIVTTFSQTCKAACIGLEGHDASIRIHHSREHARREAGVRTDVEH
jgi:hypothetical protein